jgi:DNA-binding response OmpR family regulator
MIAIVDDDPRIRSLLADELEVAGHQSCTYASGEELLNNFNRHNFQLVLLDVLMPGMGGMAVLAALQKQGFSGKVLMFSALNDTKLRQQALALGASDWLSKPNLFELLPKVLKRYLPTQ